MLYASHLHDMYDGYAYAIKTILEFEKFEITSIVKPSYRQEYKDWECLVQANIEFREQFLIVRESQKLKKIDFKIN